MAITPAELARQLDDLIPRNLKDAMQRAVLTVEAQARREAPVRTGRLRRDITSRVEQNGKRGVIGNKVSYARAVHDGTKAHVITATRAKALFWKGARHPVKSVKHPGSRPNPYFERAMQKSRGAVERELAGWMNDVLGRIG